MLKNPLPNMSPKRILLQEDRLLANLSRETL